MQCISDEPVVHLVFALSDALVNGKAFRYQLNWQTLHLLVSDQLLYTCSSYVCVVKHCCRNLRWLTGKSTVNQLSRVSTVHLLLESYYPTYLYSCVLYCVRFVETQLGLKPTVERGT